MPQGLQTDSTAETTDPRIRRSRHMLIESLAKLLSQKSFDDISIQEIAAEATLNRATFYLHYPDKDALLKALTDARFRDLIERRGISFNDCDAALRAIALGVSDYLRDLRLPRPVGSDPARKLHHPGRRGHVQGRPFPSWDGAWCRCGTAGNHRGLGRLRSRASWFQTPDRVPAEQMAAKIEAMVKPLFPGASASCAPSWKSSTTRQAT